MGIYNKGFGFDPKPLASKVQKGIPIIAGLAVAALILWFLSTLLVQEPIAFSFKKNPIKNSEQTILDLTIANTTGATARNVAVEVYAEDQFSISVAPPVQAISVLDQYRKLEFVVNPVGQTLAGNYVLNIKTEINGKEFSKKAILSIEK